MTKWLYQARLVPIGRPTTVRGDHGQPVTFSFDKHHFSRSCTAAARDIPVCLSHDHSLRVGNLRSLNPNREWWICEFELREDVIQEPFEVGQNVSIGLMWRDRDFPYVEEVSIVKRGRVPGAEITHRVERPPTPKLSPVPTPVPAKPAAATGGGAAAGEVFYGGPLIRREGIGQVLGVR